MANSLSGPQSAIPGQAAESTPAGGGAGPDAGAGAAPAHRVGSGLILTPESVVLAGNATTRDAAIDEAGRLLLARGAVDEGYLAAMHDREETVSTYMGSFLAIPHGTNAAKDHIFRSAVSVVRYPQGIDWDGPKARFVVAVAGLNNEHLHILSAIAKVFTDQDSVQRLEAATSVDEVLAIFAKVNP